MAKKPLKTTTTRNPTPKRARRNRRGETDAQFLRRVERTVNKAVKDGGPTKDDLVRAIRLRLAQSKEKAAA